MEITVQEALENGGTWTRSQLAELTHRPDRYVRLEIRRLRREGMPIMSIKRGGYKLASTPEEQEEMLHQLKGRALDLLRTHSIMSNALQVDGQISLQELLDALEATA